MNRQIATTTIAHPQSNVQPRLTKLELFVQPAMFDDLKEELVQWASTLAWSEVSYHLDKERVGVYRGLEYATDSAPMVKVEAFVPSRVLGRVMAAIERVLPPASIRRQVFAVMPAEDVVSVEADVLSGASEAAGPH